MHSKAIWKPEITETAKSFRGIDSGLYKWGLLRHIWTPSCKDQRPDAHPSWKTQSFMKNRGQQKCLNKVLYIYKYVVIFLKLLSIIDVSYISICWYLDDT